MRTIFYISDGTALTAEAFGRAMLSMFPLKVVHKTLAFIDTEAKATAAVNKINQAYADSGERPVIFHTFVSIDIKRIIMSSQGSCYDFLDYFVAPLSKELGIPAQPKTHRTHGIQEDTGVRENYDFRIDAVNYSLANDDGSNVANYDEADIILLGVSRTGKTPTSLYLALHYGIKAANYPLTEDDNMENLQLPKVLKPHRHKIFGLTLDPQRLHEIRSKRREGSTYASLPQCRFELQEVEKMYRREAIPFLDSTRFSVEEIAAKILAETNIERHRF
ncbi:MULTISPECIES: posphoenolpyruvate synthetase regulatory kinase/phosphorylase PpsR [Idiomarina]|uniref:posphoenolpyruvate synthetase regulatory kinase/phosphorylase PpsR n=1 Tax=Idiomarinaceae TaxID=267893 RepID=UPI00129A59D2|nr:MULTISPECIES: pyruvate, water dikinase regulatory protein [Idiomarina]MRJ40899.1 pyruvate, phosphate dikinase/phosphoenolpyruvate synthase regulator [Idiomarina sp. FeN1]NCU56703.1 pyruvate, phosphate dikinase/phosphoenolpyruvate synthase regulator [Idiomarina sp. FenA--70]NCU59083.1 pyruvate, phosphate dikinase/phosphoenolpyruvate synthase regulator [Idiomarina sp. FenBw--71]UUN14426.1 kinase/pyrophosphorylase [Idiomarina loihiensis]